MKLIWKSSEISKHPMNSKDQSWQQYYSAQYDWLQELERRISEHIEHIEDPNLKGTKTSK